MGVGNKATERQNLEGNNLSSTPVKKGRRGDDYAKHVSRIFNTQTERICPACAKTDPLNSAIITIDYTEETS